MLKTEVPVAKLRVVIPPLGAFLDLPPMYVMDDAPENLVNVRASLAENRDNFGVFASYSSTYLAFWQRNTCFQHVFGLAELWRS